MFETNAENSIEEKFRTRFLLIFTKELIKHSKEEFFTLSNIIKKEKPIAIEKTFEEESEKFFPSLMYQKRPITPKKEPIIFKPLPTNIPIKKQMTPLKIPEYPLPPRLQYLRPVPTNIEIDLGKLNPFIQDTALTSIECNGPEEPLIVVGRMGMRTTNIILTKEEINGVLQRFSESSKIPLREGVFKIAVGRLILSAIVSEVIGSKFIIRKMISQSSQPYYMPRY